LYSQATDVETIKDILSHRFGMNNRTYRMHHNF
jgi:hypothetical protein